MEQQFLRTQMLLGDAAVSKLASSHVAVFGIGGVGSFCTEALARAGIGELTLFDADTVDITNLNRQLIALHSTVGIDKVEAAKARIADINPTARVHALKVFYTAENAGEFDLSRFDYIVDAIDTVSSKLVLIERAVGLNVPLISCMGTGNKLHPERFEITDIYKTSVCPLAKVMRCELRRRGIKKLKVLFSTEEPVKPHFELDSAHGRHSPGSISFVPSAAGLMIAGEVIRCLIE